MPCTWLALAPLAPLHRQAVESADRGADPGGFWAILVALILGLWLLHRTLGWMGKRGWINYRGAVLGASIGNALVGFAAFFEPTRPSVESIEKVKSPRLQDQAGEPPTPEGSETPEEPPAGAHRSSVHVDETH